MSFPRYPAYKPSGVEWLGEVPEHWAVVPLKTIATVINGYPFDSKLFDPVDGFPLVRIRDLNQSSPDTYYKGEFVQAASIDNDDVLIGMDGDFNVGRWLGQVPALLNQRMCCVRSADPLIARYLRYVLPAPLRLINDITYSTTVKHLSSYDVLGLKLAVPRVNAEVEKIATFLDHETAKIDALIAEQQRLIELLQEKRQAVISHAVTKGLNPDAPMKDSGVEWLGEVPAHWETLKLSKITHKITNGYVGPTRDILVEEGVPYIQATHIKRGRINFDKSYYVRPEWSAAHSKSVLEEGDVLVVQTGAGTGDVGLVSSEDEGFNCHALIILAPTKSVISGHFLSAVLLSDCGQQKLESIQTGGMHPHLNCGNIKFVDIPVPPIDEQEAIINFIAMRTESFDNLSSDAMVAIALFQERRSALISAAVTGQIDVRGLVPEASAA